jgi:hypothetical protein
LHRRAHAARALLGTVAIAVSDPVESSSTEAAWRGRPERPRPQRHSPAWRHAAAALLGVAYAAALAAASWYSSIDVDDGGAAPLGAIATVVVWTAATILLGYLLRTWAFALIPVAVVVPAVIGERAEEFDNELRYFNWLLLIVVNAVLAAIGLWLAHRRSRRSARTSSP